MNTNAWNRTLAKHYDVFTKPAPCDFCSFKQTCKEREIACEVFYVYVQRNQHWKQDRIPNRKWWDKVFNEKDDVEIEKIEEINHEEKSNQEIPLDDPSSDRGLEQIT